MTRHSDTHSLRRVLLEHPRHAWGDPEEAVARAAARGWLGRPDVDAACREADGFADLLGRLGVEVTWAAMDGAGLDAVFVRDSSIVLDDGAVLCRMGKESRRGEPARVRSVYERLGIPVVGAVEGPGTLEGGDAAWLDPRTLAVGRGYRTNDEGIRQLESLLAPRGVDVLPVDMPHFRGPDDVFHLMSVFSPLAPDLALVHAPLVPVRLMEALDARGIGLVVMPEEEYDGQGCNVLAVAPRVVVAVDGNPGTRARMEAAGVEVHAFAGAQLSVKGQGGPTCLTRPLEREG